MINPPQTQERILQEIGKALDLSKAQYEVIIDRYNAVAAHLASDNSLLKPFSPNVAPQGSFLLGTMVKPIIESDEIDVDLVCRLSGKKPNWSQYDLKQETGNQIKASETYKRMLDEEGKRCWTLQYAEDAKFHLDILPSIVGEGHFTLSEKVFSQLSQADINKLAIRITDNTLLNHKTETSPINWPISNPFGYAAWFNDRATIIGQKTKLLSESIKPLPNYTEDKTPLQRAIQLLKRHRDIMFQGDDHKPISIIITTLSALSYNKETTVTEALSSILSRMRDNIKYAYSPTHKRNVAWIANPVNPAENFADKWPDEEIKEANFYAWLDKAILDFAALRTGDYTQIYRTLKAVLGSRSVNEGFKNAGMNSLINENYLPTRFDTKLFSISHRSQPPWLIRLSYSVEIFGRYIDGSNHISIYPQTIVPKFKDILFTASTNVPKPFEVYWQVVNTGEEAARKGGLRGDIFHSKTRGKGGVTQKEKSEYSGAHWIQCFIVKDGICVARSYEFIVNIA